MTFADIPCSPSSSSTASVNHQKQRTGGRGHPLYRSVRQRSSGKWVSEVRGLGTTGSRIWLGTFSTPEMAAVAHDVAVLTLLGEDAQLNFPDSAHRLPRAASCSHQDIRMAAQQAAMGFRALSSPDAGTNYRRSPLASSLSLCLDGENRVRDPDWLTKIDVESDGHGHDSCGEVEFVDEEAMFNMPLLIDSMAEGMLLTPPAMKKGFSWSEEADDDPEFTLW